ncbi:Signal recognition particle 19 kDa protein, partial [Bienertia sinuspersici]
MLETIPRKLLLKVAEFMLLKLAKILLVMRFENEKSYPRDFMQRGRVRGLLKSEDESFCNPEAFP